MAVFTTPELVKKEGNVPLTLDDSKILPHIYKASSEIKRLIGKELYGVIYSYSTTGAGSDEYEMFADLQIAETNLALAYFIPSLNMQTSGEGIMLSKGWDQTRIEFYSHTELKLLADNYKRTAYDIINLYIPVQPAKDDEDDDDLNIPGNFYLTSI
jgi:hypothetical protein